MIVDLAVIGGSAAGLAAAIFAAEAANGTLRIAVFERARKPGAKILVSGGGRCNVTNQRVTADDYNGGSKAIIRNVLKAFDEQRTIEWMRGMGVHLKLEPTGKYFPTTDNSRTVLDALLKRLQQSGAVLHLGCRVRTIERQTNGGFVLQVEREEKGQSGETFTVTTRRVIVATGGLALPKSGSDGTGLNWMRRIGHTIVPTTPALAPLVLAKDSSIGGRLHELSGITVDARLVLVGKDGRKLQEMTGSTLFTHFGLSGPAPMNMSRHIARWKMENPGAAARLLIGHPSFTSIEDADAWIRKEAEVNGKRLVVSSVAELWPSRFAELVAGEYGKLAELTRASRAELAGRLAALEAPVLGDRGYAFAECTAGGVDLGEINPRTMESRLVPGLYLCGEILDVDGRIGGFNFQWAWASGFLAGQAPATRLSNSVAE